MIIGEHTDIPVMVPEGMQADPGAIEQIVRCRNTPGVDHAALMADGHKGYGVPIGGVIASETHISPSGVGYDIACGNACVLTNLTYDDIKADLPRLMDEIHAQVSFGVGRKNNERAEHPVLDNPCRWVGHPLGPQAHTLAASQLGTVGSGNHYVDLLRDNRNRVWIGVHFGSRGLGHKTATYFLNAAGAKDDMDAPPCMIPVDTPLGQDYLTYMALAGDYAYAGREWVCDKVRRILGAESLDMVHNHHNYAWKETHHGRDLWVVRKGATPAFPGQRGFIGGSMGDICVIVRGCDYPDKGLLYSTVHGAGRVMSRTAATGKVKTRKVWACGIRDCDVTLPVQQLKANAPTPRCAVHDHPMHRSTRDEVVSVGLIDWQAVSGQLRADGLELRGAGADEAPGCYKPLASVLDAHRGTIVIEHMLRPIGVAMAGAEHDPYKD